MLDLRHLIPTVGLAAIASLASAATHAVGAERSNVGRALADWVDQKHSPAPEQFRYAFVDLNGDLVQEAVVLIAGPGYCGSGGCTLVVMKREDDRLKVFSSSTITREPICIAAEDRQGWKSLVVTVGGGGGPDGQAVLRFDGSRYPMNPSMQPLATKSELQSCERIALKDVSDLAHD